MKKVLVALLALFAAPAWAINGVPVQCVYKFSTGVTSVAVNSGDGWATPTSGNYLVSMAAIVNGSPAMSSLTQPAGWSLPQSETGSNGSITGGLATKTSAGSETSVTWSWTNSSNVEVAVCELSSTGLAAGGPVATGEDNTGKASGSDTAAGSGSASSTTTNSLAIALIALKNDNHFDDDSYSNSFVERFDFPAGSSTVNPGIRIATLVASASGAQTTTDTTTDAGGPNYGLIAVYNSETTAPSVSAALTEVATDTDSTSATITLTDASNSITTYCAVYADGSTPTAANVKAGAGTGFVTSTAANSGAQTSGTQYSYDSGAHLSQGVAYDVDCIGEDLYGNQTTVQKIDVITTNETTAPTVSAALTQTGITTDTVTATITTTDASGTVTDYCGVYADGSTPTAANVKAGTGTGFVTSTAANSGAVASGTQFGYSSGAHLSATTAYDVDCIGEDLYANKTAVQKIDITTDSPPANDAVLPVIVNDAFTAANGTTMAGRTPSPTNTAGNTWAKVKFYTPATLATVDIQSNQMSAGAESGAVIDVETADMDVTANIADYTVSHVIAVRVADSDNKNQCRFLGATGTVVLYSIVGGVYTTLVSAAHTFSAPYVGEMFAVGTTLGCLVDGVLVASATSSANLSSTKAGLGANSDLATFDNAYIKRAYPCLNSSTGHVNDDPNGLFFGESLQSGCLYWAQTLPAHYSVWSLYEGGRVYEDFDDADDIGTDSWTWARWNSTTNAVETATFTLTAQDTTATAAVWQAAAINLSLPIGVPYSNNLCTSYLTTQGIPQAVITKTGGTLVQNLAMQDGCTLAGTPDLDYSSAQSATFTATNASAAPTKAISIAITGDSTPDAFSFTPQTGVTKSATITSAAITISGLTVHAAITVSGSSGCKYDINASGSFVSTAGTVVNGDTVRAQVTASGSDATTTTCTPTIGGVSGAFTATTSAAADTVPDAFLFVDQLLVSTSSTITSNTITISGISAATTVTVSGGTWSKNGGAYSSSSGSVVNGDTITLRHTSASADSVATDTVLNVGGVTDTFTSITSPTLDTTPDAFTFTDVLDVELGSEVDADPVTISGLDSTAPISIVDGEWSTDQIIWTNQAGSISNGSLYVRHTASSSNSTATNTVVTIGDITDTFTSVTVAGTDTTPNAFTLPTQTGVARNATITSDTVSISGINAATNVAVSGGTWSKNGGAFSASSGTVNNSDTVAVRHTSSASFDTPTNTVLTVGNIAATFTSITLKNVPVCADVPNQSFFVDDTVVLDLSTTCSAQGAFSAFDVLPAGCVASAATVTCTFSERGHTVSHVQASNALGTSNIGITFDIRSSADDCNTSRTSPGRGHGPVLSSTRCSPPR